MPDITHPLVATPFVAGDVLDPERIAEGLYVPQSTPDNMSVVNGRLDEDNLAAGYDITHDAVRPGTMATAVSRGQTANSDFFSDFFVGDYDSDTYSEAMDRALTAVGIRFYVPYDCSLVMLSWHVGVIVDGGHIRQYPAAPNKAEDIDHLGDTAPSPTSATSILAGGVGNNTLLTLFVDGAGNQLVSRRIITGRASMFGDRYYKSGAPIGITPLEGSNADTGNDRKYWNQGVVPDHRWWSGHFNIDSGAALTKGWHTASIRVTNGKWDMSTSTKADGTAITKVAPHVRFKTCHMTAIPIR